MGIEACNWGAIKAVNCLIVENQLHGVAIGPRGIGYISGNIIEGNGHEGITWPCMITYSIPIN
jgi:hypothetical protein